MSTVRVSVLVRFPPALLESVDRARGSLPRHPFLIDLITRGLARTQADGPSAELTSPPTAADSAVCEPVHQDREGAEGSDGQPFPMSHEFPWPDESGDIGGLEMDGCE